MYKGKRTCEALKSIRQEIAVANGIAYNPRQCDHEGDCLGSCPACEQEARYIENQLNMRKLAGKAVRIVGLASVMSLSTCSSQRYPEVDHVTGKYIYEPGEEGDTTESQNGNSAEEKADSSGSNAETAPSE